MASSDDYQQLDGIAVAEGIRQRRFGAVEILDCALQLAESLNPKLNAITWPTYEKARDLARQLDGATSRTAAPFAGVPFLFKDLSAVSGLPQTSQSRLFATESSDHDAVIVKAFRQAGLISLGKTNTPELGLTITTESAYAGPCHNPWNPDYSTGGSSGGSAAAVAARIVPIAHGSDGGGSIRIPASCCGLVGHKPSRGLTPVAAELAASWSGMSVGHVLTRTVRDSAAMLDAIRLQQPVLYPLPPSPASFLATLDQVRPLKIAVQRTHPQGAELHPEVLKALDLTLAALVRAGHRIIEATPPVDYSRLSRLAGRIINVHVAQAIIPQLEKLGVDLATPLLEEATRRMAKRGAELTARDYVEAVDGLRQLEIRMEEFFRSYDVLLSPVLAQPPAPLGWLDMNSDDMKTYLQRFNSYSGFCALFNATGQPSTALPVHQSNAGLPIGILLSTRWGGDDLLLQLGRRLEVEFEWANRQPLRTENSRPG